MCRKPGFFKTPGFFTSIIVLWDALVMAAMMAAVMASVMSTVSAIMAAIMSAVATVVPAMAAIIAAMTGVVTATEANAEPAAITAAIADSVAVRRLNVGGPIHGSVRILRHGIRIHGCCIGIATTVPALMICLSSLVHTNHQ